MKANISTKIKESFMAVMMLSNINGSANNAACHRFFLDEYKQLKNAWHKISE